MSVLYDITMFFFFIDIIPLFWWQALSLLPTVITGTGHDTTKLETLATRTKSIRELNESCKSVLLQFLYALYKRLTQFYYTVQQEKKQQEIKNQRKLPRSVEQLWLKSFANHGRRQPLSRANDGGGKHQDESLDLASCSFLNFLTYQHYFTTT